MSVFPRLPTGEQRVVRRGRVRLEYFVSGQGEAVILAAGFGRSVSDFNELVGALNDAGFQTVGVQLRDVGGTRSPAWPRPTLRDFADDIGAVVQAIQPPGRRAHVLGRAFGARVVRMFAQAFPDLIGASVLMAVGGPVEPERRVLRRYAVKTSGFVSRATRRRVMQETLFGTGNRMPDYLDYRPTLRATLRQGAAVRRTPRQEWWAAGEGPLLVIHGTQDRITPVENAIALKQDFPDRVRLLTLPDAGHALLTEEPAVIEQAIVSFLREHPIDPGIER